MGVWRFKSCPKCNGDMLINRDSDGWYQWCLQCGHQHDLTDVIEVWPPDKAEKKVAKNVSGERATPVS